MTLRKTLYLIPFILLIAIASYLSRNSIHHILAEEAEIYIQAGHEGRTTGATGAEGPLGKEIEWTPIVADEATRILRAAGIKVIRTKADHPKYSLVDLALSIHFDGCEHKCRTGASIGYDDPTDQPAADAWKDFYSNFYQFNWKPDNYTRALSNYYNFRYTITKDAELVLELGEITCPEQAAWLKAHLKELGHVVAYFAAERIGKSHLLTKPHIS
ncbi:hypothetical protein GYB29_15150 [bacterium]|nr:hypothetical protein [bacterium]